MKLLNKKETDSTLKKIAAIQIMLNHYLRDSESYCYCTDYLAEIAATVGGVDGPAKVSATVEKYNRRFNDENS